MNNNNQPNSVYNYHGQLGEGTIVQNNNGFQDDEMYDGGEDDDEAQNDGRITVIHTFEEFENCLKNDGPICIVFTDRSNNIC